MVSSVTSEQTGNQLPVTRIWNWVLNLVPDSYYKSLVDTVHNHSTNSTTELTFAVQNSTIELTFTVQNSARDLSLAAEPSTDVCVL